jgi:Flp pilus assembly pilin Flp
MLIIAKAALNDRKGISSLEYAVLGAGVLGALVTAVGLLTPAIGTMFNKIISDLG